MLRRHAPKSILDVATGTGDLAIRALTLSPERIVGVDISEAMLARGREKIAEIGASDVIEMRTGASEELPFADDAFDAAMVAFGVRNFENLRGGLSEISRVLRPGGPLVVLEFSQPRHFPIKQLYGFYFRRVVPNVGRTVSRHDHAYQYLPDSVSVFPSGDDFLAEMQASGFDSLKRETLTFGIASIYYGRSKS
jgi:demethylmenaquinone methyltransferase/2-methoxy-6-polyprenyl-1,4-benzoquinol methylase